MSLSAVLVLLCQSLSTATLVNAPLTATAARYGFLNHGSGPDCPVHGVVTPPPGIGLTNPQDDFPPSLLDHTDYLDLDTQLLLEYDSTDNYSGAYDSTFDCPDDVAVCPINASLSHYISAGSTTPSLPPTCNPTAILFRELAIYGGLKGLTESFDPLPRRLRRLYARRRGQNFTSREDARRAARRRSLLELLYSLLCALPTVRLA